MEGLLSTGPTPSSFPMFGNDWVGEQMQCTKRNLLRKWENFLDQECQCKECKEKLSSFIELMKHVSRLHTKELDRDDNGANEKFREDKEDFKETKGSILNEFI